jgi:predicted metal-dependent hydrolase
MYDFDLIVSKKRKTICISVGHDLRVKVMSPRKLSLQKINLIIKEKSSWIEKKINFFKERGARDIKSIEYSFDKVFYFLGNQFTLKAFVESRNKIFLDEQDIIIFHKKESQVDKLLKKWLKQKAEEFFQERLKINFAIFALHFKVNFPALKIRQMKGRWGSMSKSGVMILNLKLIHVDLEAIDYVIFHELCHLIHYNHSDKFYKLQSSFVSNFREIRERLKVYNL